MNIIETDEFGLMTIVIFGSMIVQWCQDFSAPTYVYARIFYSLCFFYFKVVCQQ